LAFFAETEGQRVAFQLVDAVQRRIGAVRRQRDFLGVLRWIDLARAIHAITAETDFETFIPING
jgi:hypothetical protein